MSCDVKAMAIPKRFPVKNGATEVIPGLSWDNLFFRGVTIMFLLISAWESVVIDNGELSKTPAGHLQ